MSAHYKPGACLTENCYFGTALVRLSLEPGKHSVADSESIFLLECNMAAYQDHHGNDVPLIVRFSEATLCVYKPKNFLLLTRNLVRIFASDYTQS